MKVTEFSVPGPLLIELPSFGDNRGFFSERFRADIYSALHLPQFVQENMSRSKPGVLRGLHIQQEPPQGKLITCVHGRIFDAAVDLRKGSATFGQSVYAELSGENPSWLWIPPHFAHGFLTLGNSEADVWYKVSGYWNPKTEATLAWNDPELHIPWPQQPLHISEKDKIGKKLHEMAI